MKKKNEEKKELFWDGGIDWVDVERRIRNGEVVTDEELGLGKFDVKDRPFGGKSLFELTEEELESIRVK